MYTINTCSSKALKIENEKWTRQDETFLGEITNMPMCSHIKQPGTEQN
jgi:hypothetical protein